jgi:hypothetical protein
MEATLAKSFIESSYSANRDNSPSGCACTFFKIDDKWGIKTYRRREDRDICYETQWKASSYGLGPEVGERFEFRVDEKTIYCYTTEIAESLYSERYYFLQDFLRQNYWDCKLPEYQEYLDEVDNNEEKYRVEIEATVDDLFDSIGWESCDNHCGNFGYYNGRMVCIDFGND